MQTAAGGGPVAMAFSVTHVQLDSLALMRIVKQVELERQAGVVGDFAHGYLTGLVVPEEKRLEVTNCFAAKPQLAAEDAEREPTDEDSKRAAFELQEMLRRYRTMNLDYELVGFYESHPYGAGFSKALVESAYDYQSNLRDNIVLIFDPVRAAEGQIAAKAYRLSQKAMELCYVDFSPEVVKAAGITYQNMFEELPVVVKNSHLINVMLCELSLLHTSDFDGQFLELGTGGSLERCIRSLKENVDGLNRTVNEYNKYTSNKQKYDAQLENLIQKTNLENEARRARGEPTKSIEEEKKQLKPPPTLLDKDGTGMLGNLLAAAEVDAHVSYALNTAGENLAKLFLAESLVDDKGPKERTASVQQQA